jgi:hypothetical protein
LGVSERVVEIKRTISRRASQRLSQRHEYVPKSATKVAEKPRETLTPSLRIKNLFENLLEDWTAEITAKKPETITPKKFVPTVLEEEDGYDDDDDDDMYARATEQFRQESMPMMKKQTPFYFEEKFTYTPIQRKPSIVQPKKTLGSVYIQEEPFYQADNNAPMAIQLEELKPRKFKNGKVASGESLGKKWRYGGNVFLERFVVQHVK